MNTLSTQKIPCWCVLGEKDLAANAATLESRAGEQKQLPIDEIIKKLVTETKEKE